MNRTGWWVVQAHFGRAGFEIPPPVALRGGKPIDNCAKGATLLAYPPSMRVSVFLLAITIRLPRSAQNPMLSPRLLGGTILGGDVETQQGVCNEQRCETNSFGAVSLEGGDSADRVVRRLRDTAPTPPGTDDCETTGAGVLAGRPSRAQ